MSPTKPNGKSAKRTPQNEPPHVLLVYDIVEDKRRTRIAAACLDYGLDRIQYSAFAGVLTRNQQEELMLKIEALLEGTPGSIHLYVIGEDVWKRRIIIELNPNQREAYEQEQTEDDYEPPLTAD